MKLTFLGTQGNIETKTDRHRMHSSLMVTYYAREVLIDCGEDWLGRVAELNPRAIVVTHHPLYGEKSWWRADRAYAASHTAHLVSEDGCALGDLHPSWIGSR